MTAKWALHSGRPLGLQPNRSSAAQRWEEAAAPQRSLRRLPHLHRHHFQHLRRLHRQLRLQPQDRQHPADQWIPSTVPSIPWTVGPPTRKRGAAESTPSVALSPSCQFHSQSHSLLYRPILTIALTASQIGRLVGQWPKRSGAAESTARAVRIKAVAV